MSWPKMHADEVDIDTSRVRALVAGQFPEWAKLPLEPVRFGGTDNAIYRLGDALAVRLPRHERTQATLRKEREWLPRLAKALPLAVPVPVGEGEPAHGYPFDWSIYRWLPGGVAGEAPIADLPEAALALAEFIAALQRIDPSGGPPPGAHNVGRGQPLSRRDEQTREWIAALDRRIDTDAVTAIWEEALAAEEWRGPAVWIHGDLDARNVIVEDGRLAGVIDFGTLGVGDPAADVMAAWKLFDDDARARFREALDIDDATWLRARGWAASQAVGALAYYTEETNPILVREGKRWLDELLERR